MQLVTIEDIKYLEMSALELENNFLAKRLPILLCCREFIQVSKHYCH